MTAITTSSANMPISTKLSCSVVSVPDWRGVAVGLCEGDAPEGEVVGFNVGEGDGDGLRVGISELGLGTA